MRDPDALVSDLTAGEGFEISVSDVSKFVDSGAIPESVRLVDCREEDEFALCKIQGAELVPLSTFAGRDFSLLLDPEVPVVIYCHHGMRSAHAAEFLRSSGYPLAFSMAGGIDKWSSDIDPSIHRY